MTKPRIYVGQTRSGVLIKRLVDLGFGEMTARGELPPRRTPWAYDNGAFSDWRAGIRFDERRFEMDLRQIERAEVRPDFLVVPDLVTRGRESLDFSLAWLERLPERCCPYYLAVQDGMEPAEVLDATNDFDGLFVGGSLTWKLRTGEVWAAIARHRNKPSHAGRVGTFSRLRWAIRCGFTSVDSCLPLWSEENLLRFVAGLAEDRQLGWWEHPQNIEALMHGFGVR